MSDKLVDSSLERVLMALAQAEMIPEVWISLAEDPEKLLKEISKHSYARIAKVTVREPTDVFVGTFRLRDLSKVIEELTRDAGQSTALMIPEKRGTALALNSALLPGHLELWSKSKSSATVTDLSAAADQWFTDDPGYSLTGESDEGGTEDPGYDLKSE